MRKLSQEEFKEILKNRNPKERLCFKRDRTF